jgi:hypothetical protein
MGKGGRSTATLFDAVACLCTPQTLKTTECGKKRNRKNEETNGKTNGKTTMVSAMSAGLQVQESNK